MSREGEIPMKRNICIRPARHEDAATIAQVVAMAISDEATLRNYCGEEYLDVLEEIARHENTQYGWPNALIAEVDGVVAGAVIGYDGAKLASLRKGTLGIVSRMVGRIPAIEDETQAGEYYLDSIGVFPNFRAMGVGRALIEALYEKAFAEGHDRVGLIVDCDNTNAGNLYSALGFEYIGAKPFFGHMMWNLQKQREH